MRDLDDLLAAAKTAQARAYAPYSRFQVGAALRDETGQIHAGCNVENAAYPQSQCAEATAIGSMIAAGSRRIMEILVIGNGDSLCSPCGGCRQRIREFAASDVKIHIAGPSGIRKTITIADLLPLSFGPDNLTS